MTQPKILVMGNAVADVVAIPVDNLPQQGSLHPDSVTFHPGGCGGNVAIILARLGIPTQLVARVGQDAFGTALIQQWSAAGVDLTYTKTLPNLSTGVSIVLIDSQGERRFISAAAANNYLFPMTLPPKALNGAFALHIGGFFAALGLEDGTLPDLLAQAQNQGILTTLDPVDGSARERRDAFYPLLPHLDICLLNLDEGEKITDQQEPAAIAHHLLAHGAKTIIVKNGPQGCFVFGEHGPLTLPAYPATPIDTTGAGDSFVAALLASLARGKPFPEALHWASAAGAATVESLGATGSWKGWETLAEIRKRVLPTVASC